MKRMIAIATAALLTLALCACQTQGGANPTSQSTGAQSQSTGQSGTSAGSGGQEIDNSETTIGVMTQEYIDDNIAEILMIDYNGSQPALAQFGGKNPEIDSINNAIKNGIQQIYLEFMDSKADDSPEWMEIKSYPFTSDEYLQIVTSYIVYPTYGTNGSITSYNFNKKENRCVTVQDAMREQGLTAEMILQSVKELYEPEVPSMSVAEANPTGFLIRPGASGSYTLFLLEVLVDNTEAEPWSGLFAYVPHSQELYELGIDCLFDPYDMDEMDPPLSYRRD